MAKATASKKIDESIAESNAGTALFKTECPLPIMVSLGAGFGELEMNRTLAAAIFALLCAHAASAQEARPFKGGASTDWTGVYAGIDAGYGFGSSSSYLDAPASIYDVPGEFPSKFGFSTHGALGGVELGYNWQQGNIVAGIETDFSFADMKDTAAFYYPGDGFANAAIATSQDVKISSLGTLRGRLGWLITPTTLLYATGGLAYGQVKISTTDAVEGGPPIINLCAQGNIVSGLCFNGSKTSVPLGYTVGGGLETKLWGNWSAKIEYLYFDLGSIKTQLHSQLPILTSFTVLESETSIHGDVVRVGLNYQFH